MARKIDISFKNTTKEKEMYDYFANKSFICGIKKIRKEVVKKKQVKN